MTMPCEPTIENRWIENVGVTPLALQANKQWRVERMQGFSSSVSMYAGSMLGLMIGQGWISTNVAFAFMLALNVVNIPLGCLAMGDRPGEWECSNTPLWDVCESDLACIETYRGILRRLFHC